jgi:hypothetical protein
VWSTRDSRNLVQQVSRNSRINARKLADDLVTATGKYVRFQTIRNRLHESGYKGRAARKNPLSMTETGEHGWNSHAPM